MSMLKDAILEEISWNCNRTEIGVYSKSFSLIENETQNRHMKKKVYFAAVSLQSCPDYVSWSMNSSLHSIVRINKE